MNYPTKRSAEFFGTLTVRYKTNLTSKEQILLLKMSRTLFINSKNEINKNTHNQDNEFVDDIYIDDDDMEYSYNDSVWDQENNTIATPRRNSTLNRMEAVRTNLANKRGIFLGFTYSEFKKSKLLDPTQVRKWKPKEVMLYLASRSELNVLRSELDRDVWNDIDGETLLELEAEDLVAKKIKKYRKVFCFSFCFF